MWTQVGIEASPRPDNDPSGRHQRGDSIDRGLDVLLRDVPEDAAEHQQIDRQNVDEDARITGIVNNDSYRVKSCRGCVTGPDGRKPLFLFHKNGRGTTISPAFGEHRDEITTVPRTQAEHPTRPGTEHVERLTDSLTDNIKPSRQRRPRVVVCPMPCHPIRHVPTLPARPVVRTAAREIAALGDPAEG